jgi:hypothetical protein
MAIFTVSGLSKFYLQQMIFLKKLLTLKRRYKYGSNAALTDINTTVALKLDWTLWILGKNTINEYVT